MNDAQDVAVISVSYYSGDHLQHLIESLRLETDAPIVVANNAIDDSLSPLDGLPGVRVEHMESNLGYGTAANRAIASLTQKPRWLLVVNPDVRFLPGSLRRLIAVADESTRIGVAGPLVRDPAGSIYPSARRLPSLTAGIGHALFANIWIGNPWTASYLDDARDPTQQRDAGWVSGSCMLIRREAFESVGGFDPSYFMYFEDVDLCRRIAEAGYRVLFAPSAEVVHAGGHATLKSGVDRAMLVAHHRSAYRYLAARYSAWYLWPLRVALRIGLTIRSRIR